MLSGLPASPIRVGVVSTPPVRTIPATAWVEAPRELLEPYFFDFAGDLYGRKLEVELISFLRPEAKFDSLAGLTDQMAKDCEEARRRLATHRHSRDSGNPASSS